MRKRVITWSLAALALLAAVVVVGYLILDRPRPRGTPGPRADALAERMAASVDCAAWAELPAVAWTFGGRQRHLWDRSRQLARVEWGKVRALVDLRTGDGVAFEDGTRLDGSAAARRIDEARSHWVNDSFWLNPVCKAFDDGTERSLVVGEDDSPALLVSYTSGGETPGDAYLWLLDSDGRPVAWRMWVSILPVGGLRATWDDWIDLPGGARVATRHRLAGLLTLGLDDVEAVTIESGPDDPFVDLVRNLFRPSVVVLGEAAPDRRLRRRS